MFPKRTANIILTSSHAEIAPALHCAFQLACVNRKISEMSRSSNADVHSIFAEAAFLAGRAIEGATELQRMPGMSVEVFADTLGFDAACGTSPKKPPSIHLEKTARSRKRWSYSACFTYRRG